MSSMRTSIGERQDVCSGGGHFFVDEGDPDADGTDMSILDLRGCDRCSQLFGQIGTQCTEASAERETIGDQWSSMRLAAWLARRMRASPFTMITPTSTVEGVPSASTR